MAGPHVAVGGSSSSMEAEIPAANLRIFVRALQLLSRVAGGGHIVIESAADRIVMRALSDAQSSYFQIAFAQSFFTRLLHHPPAGAASAAAAAAAASRPAASYSLSPSLDTDSSLSPSFPSRSLAAAAAAPSAAPVRYFTVMVASKLPLVPFKGSLAAVKRVTMRFCAVGAEGFAELEGKGGAAAAAAAVNAGGNKRRRRNGDAVAAEREQDVCLMLQLHLEDEGVVKQFRIPSLEMSGVLQPDFSRVACPTVVGTKARKFITWMHSFAQETQELSLTFSSNTVRLRTYLDWQSLAEQTAALDPSAAVSSSATAAERRRQQQRLNKTRSTVLTESSVPASDFSIYRLSAGCTDAALIFSAPELRLFASLCEQGDDELLVFAVQPGQPVIITNTAKPMLTVEQQRAAREQRRERAAAGGGGGSEEREAEDVVMSTIPPTPTSVPESQYSFDTQAAAEQEQRSWSGELVIATLASNEPQQPQQPQQQPAPSPPPAAASPPPSQ